MLWRVVCLFVSVQEVLKSVLRGMHVVCEVGVLVITLSVVVLLLEWLLFVVCVSVLCLPVRLVCVWPNY